MILRFFIKIILFIFTSQHCFAQGIMATNFWQGGGVDPYFSNVVLLSHMDGTNGSTTFTDVKSHAMTAVGNAQVSTGTKKMGTGSLYVDGTGDRVTLADSVDWTLGSGDFTIELWWNPATTNQLSTTVLLAQGVGGVPASSAWWLELVGTNGANMTFFPAVGAAYQTTTVTAHGMTAGNWYHIAVVRIGNTVDIFINGVNRTTGGGTLTGTLNDSATTLGIGDTAGSYPANGYIDEVRITKGIARYTDTFIPMVLPFPDR